MWHAAKRMHVDRPLALLIAILVLAGGMIFASAAFGLLARGSVNISSVAFNHLALGIGVGLLALVIGSHINYTLWRRFAPHISVLALVATAAAFLPGLGMEHGGGGRGVNIAGLSLQPSGG